MKKKEATKVIKKQSGQEEIFNKEEVTKVKVVRRHPTEEERKQFGREKRRAREYVNDRQKTAQLIKEAIEKANRNKGALNKLLDQLVQKKAYEEMKATFRDLLKVNRFIDDLRGREAMAKKLLEPSLNINGIWSGYTGEGTKTVLPWKATAKVDVRLVPNMKVKDVLPMIRRHLDKHGFPEVRIRELETGYGWAKLSPSHSLAQAVIETFREFGHDPVIYPNLTGSAPFSMFAQEPFNLPFIAGGLGHGARAHSPDEYIVVDEGGPTAGLATLEKSFVVMLNRISQIK